MANYLRDIVKDGICICLKSICFFVAQYRACPRHGGVDGHRDELRMEVGQGAAFQVDGAQRLDVVAQGVGVCQSLRPARHTGDWREQTAHKDEYYEEEEHQQGGLLHGGRTVGDDEAEARHDEEKQQGIHDYKPDAAARPHAVEDVCPQHRPEKHEETDNPVRHELREDEVATADRRYVDLLDGAFLLFSDDVQRRQIAYKQRQKHGDDARHHEHLIVERNIEEETRTHVYAAVFALPHPDTSLRALRGGKI